MRRPSLSWFVLTSAAIGAIVPIIFLISATFNLNTYRYTRPWVGIRFLWPTSILMRSAVGPTDPLLNSLLWTAAVVANILIYEICGLGGWAAVTMYWHFCRQPSVRTSPEPRPIGRFLALAFGVPFTLLVLYVLLILSI